MRLAGALEMVTCIPGRFYRNAKTESKHGETYKVYETEMQLSSCPGDDDFVIQLTCNSLFPVRLPLHWFASSRRESGGCFCLILCVPST